MTRPIATPVTTLLTNIAYQQGRVCARCGLNPPQLQRLSASNWVLGVPAGAMLCQKCFALCTGLKMQVMSAGR